MDTSRAALLRRAAARTMLALLIASIWGFAAWCSSLEFMINFTAVTVVILMSAALIWGYVSLIDRWWHG
jgi:hypothetical protein